MRLVTLAMITEDMVLAQPIYHADNLVLKEGVSNINRFTKRLNNLGINSIYVYDELSDGIEIPDVISDETRRACKKVLKKTLDDLIDDNRMDSLELSDMTTQVIEEIIKNKDVQLSLNDISAADEYTLAHSVSTTIYSLVIAKELNYNKSMLHKLATGALLHDVGKVALRKEVIFKPDKLTKDEYDYVKLHVDIGYEILKKSSCITELSRIIALTHHERIDGSGYPKGLKSNEIHEFAKIVAIADVYDALTSDRCYRSKMPAHKAAEYLLQNLEGQFDAELVSIFIKQIALFPNGSLVKLSNNQFALVEKQNKEMPLRPVVRVIADSKKRKMRPFQLDLMEELSVTILLSEIELLNDNRSIN